MIVTLKGGGVKYHERGSENSRLGRKRLFLFFLIVMSRRRGGETLTFIIITLSGIVAHFAG